MYLLRTHYDIYQYTNRQPVKACIVLKTRVCLLRKSGGCLAGFFNYATENEFKRTMEDTSKI